MLNELSHKFLDNPNEVNALNILKHTCGNKLYDIGIVMGDFFTRLFPFSLQLMEYYAINAHYGNYHKKSFEIFEEALKFKGLDEQTSFRLLFNQHFSFNHVENDYIQYNRDIVESIINRPQSEIPLVTLSITTCKRFDLFEKTMNSLLQCLDIEMVDNWLCIDDNSSEEDKLKMKEMYPFFTFIFKDARNKGHPRSMNIIKNIVITPYLFHLEDDWKFFAKRNYIKDCLDVLNSDVSIGQCLLNKNYTEIESDIGIKGGIFNTTLSGLRYYIHEFVNTDDQRNEWYNKYGDSLSSNYWPHFSLRPSLLRTSIFKDIGDFNENIGHFEMEYAYRYVNKGYKSAFLEGIYCFHTGRLTSEKFDETKINAYKLNNEDQFVKNKPFSPIEETSEVNLADLCFKIKTYVLNLDRRPDRWDNFRKSAKTIEFLNYERFSAVDGSRLKSTPQLQRIFDGNDYNMKVGAVGCAMSHFKMYIELMNSEYDCFLILEDDIEVARDFDVKLLHLCNELKNVEWDLVFLGHHPKNLDDISHKDNKFPIVEKWDVFKSFQNSLGGTIGYIINKNGASRVLDFINENRLINCIDTALQKCANSLNIYYISQHLVFSKCFRPDKKDQEVDTDIQNNFSSLSISLEQKIQDEIDYYKKNDIIVMECASLEELNTHVGTSDVLFYKGELNLIKNICNEKNFRHYTFDDQVIFIIITEKQVRRYFHIFKVDDKYTIDDCFA